MHNAPGRAVCYYHCALQVFKRLYSELQIRHALELSETKNSLFSYSDYCDSMEIYLGLFNLLLNECKEPLNFDLPLEWIWDIIYGFLRQHQSYLLWRSDVKKRSLKERQLLRDSDNLWTVELVLNALNTVVGFSNINEQLEAYHRTKDPEAAKEVRYIGTATPVSRTSALCLLCHISDYPDMKNTRFHCHGSKCTQHGVCHNNFG